MSLWGSNALLAVGLTAVVSCSTPMDTSSAITVVTTPSDRVFGPYIEGDFVRMPADVCPMRATKLEIRLVNDQQVGLSGESDLSGDSDLEVQILSLPTGPYKLSAVCRGRGFGPYLAYYEWEVQVLAATPGVGGA